jgi:hypothetical protein
VCSSDLVQLTEGDYTSIGLLRDAEPILRAALGPRYERIAQQIRQFNFKAALDTLKGAEP